MSRKYTGEWISTGEIWILKLLLVISMFDEIARSEYVLALLFADSSPTLTEYG